MISMLILDPPPTHLFESVLLVSSRSLEPQCHEFFVVLLPLHFQLILHIFLHQRTHLEMFIICGARGGGGKEG